MIQRLLRFNVPAFGHLPFAKPLAHLNARFSRLSRWRIVGIGNHPDDGNSKNVDNHSCFELP